MAEFFEMPQASPTMEAGRILSWKKAEGDALAPQDVIAEVETDKAAMEIEVFDNGVLVEGRAPIVLGDAPDGLTEFETGITTTDAPDNDSRCLWSPGWLCAALALHLQPLTMPGKTPCGRFRVMILAVSSPKEA